MIAPLIGFLVAWETTAFRLQSLGYRRSTRQLSSSLLRPPPTTWSLSSTSSPTAVDALSEFFNDDNNNLNTSKSLYLYNPSERDKHYQGNIAQYLLDLHHNGATFDFCGGMIFQLVLTDKLISHLEPIASSFPSNNMPLEQTQQPVIHPASQSLMSRIPDYNKSSYADNISIFHGREIRKVTNAKGGMGFVLQLSFADDCDAIPVPDSSTINASSNGNTNAGDFILPKGANAVWNGQPVDLQGWSESEITTYDGWRSDTFRQWRNARMYESEERGYSNFSQEMGKEAYGLHHRFFLHYDDRGRMWLSAEDGCEGTPIDYESKQRGGLFGKLLDGMMFGN